MRSSILVTSLLLALPFASGQPVQQVLPAPDCQFFFTLTAAASAPVAGFNNLQQGCATWAISYTSTGFTGLTVTLQSAANNNGTASTFAAGFAVQQNSVSGSNSMTSTVGGFWWVQGTNAFVRAALSGLTGSGTVNGVVSGWRIPSAAGSSGGGTPSGPAGGDLSGTYPNPTVANLSNVTNASLANIGLVNSSITINGIVAALGATVTIPTNTISVSSPSLDLICAHGSDTTVAQLTITGATNAAPPVFTVSTSPITAGYLVGQHFTVTGVTPSAYNATYTVGALTGTTLTGSGSAPGSAYVSGGTAYMPCNNSVDATTATGFSTAASIPGGTFGANTSLHVDSIYAGFNSGAGGVATSSGVAFDPSLAYGATALYSPAVALVSSGPITVPPANGTNVSASTTLFVPFLVTSPAAGTLYAALAFSNPLNGSLPAVVSTSATANLTPGVIFAAQGLKSGTYTSGGTITGSATQTCTLTSIGSVLGATATVALTGTNTIAAGTALTITNTGQGTNSVATPTTATLGNGTATCSGTATIAAVLGGSQGAAMRLLSTRTWQQ